MITKEDCKRGDFIVVETSHSICIGYLEGIYHIGDHSFINLAGTRKRKQGKAGEDWYDHVYSVRLDRIVSFKIIDLK